MMAAKKKLPVKAKKKAPKKEPAKSVVPQALPVFESLRREVDRVFEDFGRGSWLAPFRQAAFDLAQFWPTGLVWGAAPAVDIVENEKNYEIAADVPGMDQKDLQVKVSDAGLTIKGQKQEEREEKDRGYHLQERRFGSFQRTFGLPEGVDAANIEASFKKGVLTVTLPKKPGAKGAKHVETTVTIKTG
jgi:HSP20 family protein